MSANLKQYDPKLITIVMTPLAGGAPIYMHRGISDGTFVTVARNVPRNSLRVGGDGEGTKISSNNRSGLLTVTHRNGSLANAQVSAVLEVEEATGAGNLFNLSMKDFSGTSLYDSPDAFFMGFPERSFSEGSEDDLAWEIGCLNLLMFHGGHSDAK